MALARRSHMTGFASVAAAKELRRHANIESDIALHHAEQIKKSLLLLALRPRWNCLPFLRVQIRFASEGGKHLTHLLEAGPQQKV